MHIRARIALASSHRVYARVAGRVHDVRKYIQSLSDAEHVFVSEVATLLNLILVLPSTNAVSERSFSAMRRLKTYLRATMRQE